MMIVVVLLFLLLLVEHVEVAVEVESLTGAREGNCC